MVTLLLIIAIGIVIVTISRVKRRKKPPKRVTNLKVRAKIIIVRRRKVTVGILTWTYPSQRTDGTAISPTDTLTATIFDSFSPGPGIGTAMGNAGAAGTFTAGAGVGLIPGTHNFTVTITDSEGNTSAVSNIATLVVPSILAPPNAVTDLSVMAGP